MSRWLPSALLILLGIPLGLLFINSEQNPWKAKPSSEVIRQNNEELKADKHHSRSVVHIPLHNFFQPAGFQAPGLPFLQRHAFTFDLQDAESLARLKAHSHWDLSSAKVSLQKEYEDGYLCVGGKSSERSELKHTFPAMPTGSISFVIGTTSVAPDACFTIQDGTTNLFYFRVVSDQQLEFGCNRIRKFESSEESPFSIATTLAHEGESLENSEDLSCRLCSPPVGYTLLANRFA